jgi:hypothetical protein
MAQLPRGADFDRRLTVAPRGIVKVNSMIDERELILNQQRCTTRPDDVLYRGTALRGEWSNEATKVYDYEPAAIVKTHAARGASRGLTQTGGRNIGNQDYRVPIVSVVNGAPGKTASDIQARYSILGVTEQTGRYSGSEGLNTLLAGMITITNSGDQTIHAGDYVGAFVPNETEADRIHGDSGNMANRLGKNGRIPFIYKSINPGAIDYHQREVIEKVVGRIYTDDGAAANPRYKRDSTKVQNASKEDFIDHRLNLLVDDLVMSLASMLAMIYTAPGVFDNTTGMRGIPHETAINEAIQMLLVSGNPAYYQGAVPGTPVSGKSDDDILGYNKLLVAKKDPIGQMLHALDSFRFAVADVLIGRAAHTMPPGKSGDIIIGKLNN